MAYKPGCRCRDCRRATARTTRLDRLLDRVATATTRRASDHVDAGAVVDLTTTEQQTASVDLTTSRSLDADAR